MYQNQSELHFSFGNITCKVSAEGNIDRPQSLLDHMLATAMAVTSAEVIHRGIATDNKREESKDRTVQTCVATATFGEITVTTELGFNSKQHISRRALNSLVFGAILPKVWETIGVYLGDHQAMTSPNAPLSAVPERQVLAHLSQAMGLERSLISSSDLISLAGLSRTTSGDTHTTPQLAGSR